MALIGNCTYTIIKDSETETETITETDAEGNSVEKTIPKRIEEKTDYTNVYVAVKQVQFYDSYVLNESLAIVKNTTCFYHLAGYTDKAAKYDDCENYLFWEQMALPSFNYDENIYSQIYNHVKTLEGYTELQNDI